MRVVMITFPIIGLQIVSGNFFQSIGNAKKPFFVLVASGDISHPAIIDFATFFGIKGVWFCMPISDVVATIIAAVMLKRHFRNIRNIQKKETKYFTDSMPKEGNQ